MGSYIWNCILGETSVESILESIVLNIDVKDVNVEEIREDVISYIDLLSKEGFLEVT